MERPATLTAPSPAGEEGAVVNTRRRTIHGARFGSIAQIPCSRPTTGESAVLAALGPGFASEYVLLRGAPA